LLAPALHFSPTLKTTGSKFKTLSAGRSKTYACGQSLALSGCLACSQKGQAANVALVPSKFGSLLVRTFLRF
jgi:hypothetical protein